MEASAGASVSRRVDSQYEGFWTLFLRPLKTPGLHAVGLVVSTAHAGPETTISAEYGCLSSRTVIDSISVSASSDASDEVAAVDREDDPVYE